MEKIYSCNYSYFSVYVNIDGKEVEVVFRGGYGPNSRFGEYRTNDAAVQAALEKHPQYNIRFRCIGGSNVKDTPNVPDADKTKVKPAKNKTTTADKTPDPILEVRDVKTYQAAKEWLIKEKGILPDAVKNEDELRNLAKDLLIDFVDWK